MSVISPREQAQALLRRARTGMAFAALGNAEPRFVFWQGYAECAQDMVRGLGKDAADKDRSLANEPHGHAQAAGAALPECTKALTIGQAQQILAAQGIEVATEEVAQAEVGAGEVFEHGVIAAAERNDEQAAARVDVGDGAGEHGDGPQCKEAAIVAQQGGAA